MWRSRSDELGGDGQALGDSDGDDGNQRDFEDVVHGKLLEWFSRTA